MAKEVINLGSKSKFQKLEENISIYLLFLSYVK